MFFVISYDITDDKRRNKVAKCLENYGIRVQYSVFEVICEEEIINKIISELNEIINPNEDSVRIYLLCSNCVSKIAIIGCGEVTKDLEVYIV